MLKFQELLCESDFTKPTSFLYEKGLKLPFPQIQLPYL